MSNRPKNILGGAGFAVVLLLCLTAVGAVSYFTLFRGNSSDAIDAEPETAAQTSAADAQAPVAQAAAEAEVAAAGSAAMPEAEVDPEPAAETLETVDAAPVAAEAPNLVVSPLQGKVVSAFSEDRLSYDETLNDWRTHDGMDISAAAGTTVLAACAGTVLSVEDDALMGTTVTLSHSGGYRTTYANLQAKPTVKKGDQVSAGQILGAVGSTSIAEAAEGPHLHFSVTKNGSPMDPEDFLKR